MNGIAAARHKPGTGTGRKRMNLPPVKLARLKIALPEHPVRGAMPDGGA
jgi:hypothetical protein